MQITINNEPFNLSGRILTAGEHAPDVVVTEQGGKDVHLPYLGTELSLLNVFPRVAGKVCSSSMLFLERELELNTIDCQVLSISCDSVENLQSFRAEHNISRIVSYSDLPNRAFGRNFGLSVADGPFEGLLARAVFLVQDSKILYRQFHENIAEPINFTEVFQAIESL